MKRIIRHGREIEVETLPMSSSTLLEDRHFGCPVSWLLRILPVVAKSGKQLAVAIYVWKRYVVCGCRVNFDMPNGGLKQLGISRHTKYRTLVLLAKAGVITMKQTGKETFLITILPEKPKRRKHK